MLVPRIIYFSRSVDLAYLQMKNTSELGEKYKMSFSPELYSSDHEHHGVVDVEGCHHVVWMDILLERHVTTD